MTQYPIPALFAQEVAPHRANASPTSIEAAHASGPSNAARRDMALKFIRSQGVNGATFGEVAHRFGWEQSQSGRFTELKRDGLIVDSGTTRTTRTGCKATVYVAKEFA